MQECTSPALLHFNVLNKDFVQTFSAETSCISLVSKKVFYPNLFLIGVVINTVYILFQIC